MEIIQRLAQARDTSAVRDLSLIASGYQFLSD
jgi:hypothetical protein